MRMKRGVWLDEHGYQIACGLPEPVPRTKFDLDPEVKEEYVWGSANTRKSVMML